MRNAAHFARRFTQLVEAARREGVAVIADGSGCVRFAPAADLTLADDLRQVGVAVKVTEGCGGGSHTSGGGMWTS